MWAGSAARHGGLAKKSTVKVRAASAIDTEAAAFHTSFLILTLSVTRN